MCKLLLISFEATEPNPVTASIQQVTLTFVEKSSKEDVLVFLKELSFFVDNYTPADFFDVSRDIPLVEDLSYHTFEAYESLSKRYSKEDATALIQKAVNYAEYVVVHNGLDYHIPILQRDGVDFTGRIILDTAEHVSYVAQVKSRKLLHLCAEHNFLLYGDRNKRPRTESINKAMLTLLNLYSPEESMKTALEEGKKTILLVAKIDYSQNAEAKKLGFVFDYNTKRWLQKVSPERHGELLAIMGEKHLEVVSRG